MTQKKKKILVSLIKNDSSNTIRNIDDEASKIKDKNFKTQIRQDILD